MFVLRRFIVTSGIVRALGVGCLVYNVQACASGPKPMLVSSATGAGYAMRYADRLGAAVDTFIQDKRQAHELASTLVDRAPKPNGRENLGLVLRIVQEADADGRRDAVVQARRSDRALRALWESERGALGSRITNGLKKQLTETGCAETDTQATVHQALRDGMSLQLDKRARAESEAQRLLEQYKSQLSPVTATALQRNVDDVTRASYLTYNALAEDVVELQRLLREQPEVVKTLQAAVDYEHSLQIAGLTPAELKASEARVQQISSKLVATADAKLWAEKELGGYQQQLQRARDEYERAYAVLCYGLNPAVAQTARAQ